jgi:hypothetical protein
VICRIVHSLNASLLWILISLQGQRSGEGGHWVSWAAAYRLEAGGLFLRINCRECVRTGTFKKHFRAEALSGLGALNLYGGFTSECSLDDNYAYEAYCR